MTARTPATFSHPDWLRAVLAQVPGSVEARVPPSGFPKLTAAWRKRHWPLPFHETMVTALTPAGLPGATSMPTPTEARDLIDAGECPILFHNMLASHPVTRQLLESAAHVHVLRRWQRAGLVLKGTYDNWLQENFDQKRRKELKRLRQRLSEQGKLESISLSENSDLQPFIDAFLQLEHAGWKGARGTAIANDPAMSRALSAGLAAMHAHGRLRFWQINFDGRPIASLFALIDDGEATLGKIAHDESFAKFSPGVLVILDATAALFAEPDLELADSNAIPGHPMIDRIWRDRIDCLDVLVAGTATPTPVFSLLAAYLGTKNAARLMAKRVVKRITGRKTS